MQPDPDATYLVSTHERCSGPCPSIRKRVAASDQLEPKGQWGPYVETTDGDRIAEGHEGVESFLAALR